jgi:hypothetical protein
MEWLPRRSALKFLGNNLLSRVYPREEMSPGEPIDSQIPVPSREKKSESGPPALAGLLFQIGQHLSTLD